MFDLLIAGYILISLIFYAVTGGADFGGGVWYLFATGPRASRQRQAIAGALAPIWEANHVWLILVVVVLFTGFPPAFSAMMTALNIPVTLMLLGIIMRGASFIFRKYETRSNAMEVLWSNLFGVACFITPVLEGIVLGALCTGQIRVIKAEVTTGFFAGWLTPFALVFGLAALALCAFLAATYLTTELKGNASLQNDFRIRALLSGIAFALLLAATIFFARADAPEFFRALPNKPVLLLGSAAFTGLSVAVIALWRKKFVVAQIAAIAAAAAVLGGWAMAQYPFWIRPDVTIGNSTAPVATLRLLFVALSAGAILLLPSLAFLFYLFKGSAAARPAQH
jgi:cytochrome d ubiquinol oxidase subunit II